MNIAVGFMLMMLCFEGVAGVFFRRNYSGSRVYHVKPKNKKQLGLVNGLNSELDGIDIWQYAHIEGRGANIMVHKESQPIFEAKMEKAGVPYKVYIADAHGMAVKEVQENQNAKAKARASTISFTSYHRHDEINSYMDNLALSFPNLVTVKTLGPSTEGRAVKAIVISTSGGTDIKKPVIISDAGNHAREWIGTAVALYMINKLVEEITESDVVNKLDWVIIPVLNPDGYEFSHTDNRFWRKTRSPNFNSSCIGVDGNRNFDFQWMISGSSANPCYSNYAGPKAFSEPETRYLRNVIDLYRSRAKAYISLHSYGSYVLYPYGYTGSLAPDNAELNKICLSMITAINNALLPEVSKYVCGSAGAALYPCSGGSDDYAYAVGKIKLSFTFELPGGGLTGFDMPPSSILQVVNETWQGIVVLARYVIAQNNP